MRARLLLRQPLLAVCLFAAIFGLVVSPASAQVRVACVGDSITRGATNGDAEVNAWPLILGRMLEAVDPGEYEVFNFGATGATTLRDGVRPYWGEPEYAQSLLSDPDIVIVVLGTNDARDANWGPFSGRFAGDLRDLVDSYRDLPSAPEVHLANLSQLTPWYRYIDEVSPNRPEIEAILRDVAAEYGLGIVDLATATAGDLLLVPDGIHPNSEGNERIAREAFRAIRGEPSALDPTILPAPIEPGGGHIVVEGKSRVLGAHGWFEDDGWLQGTGAGNRLTSPLGPIEGDFHLRARLSIRNPDISGAHIFLDNEVIGFVSARSTIYRDGPRVGGLRFIGPSTEYWTPGDWIDAEIVRRGELVWFLIDGRVALTVTIPGTIGSVGFEPGTAKLLLSEWSIDTEPAASGPERFERRTVGTPWVDAARHGVALEVIDRKPGAVTGGLPQISSPDGSELFEFFGAGGSVSNARGRVSGDGGTTWSAPFELPLSLAGLGHRALDLPDGRVAVAFWDRHLESPTVGNLVLWMGSYGELRDAQEGRYTAVLTGGWTPPTGSTAESPFVSIGAEPNGVLVVTAAGVDPFDGENRLVRARIGIDELDAQVPGLSSRAPSVVLTEVQGPVSDIDIGADVEPTPASLEVVDGGTTIVAAFRLAGQATVAVRRSLDAGATWSSRVLLPIAAAEESSLTLHRVDVPGAAAERILLFAGGHPLRVAVSDDGGVTWSSFAPMGLFGGLEVSECLQDPATGELSALFHDNGRYLTSEDRRDVNERRAVYSSTSLDGGLSWSPAVLAVGDPYLSLDGAVALTGAVEGDRSLLVADVRDGRGARLAASPEGDDGWGVPRELPFELRGRRHGAVELGDGRTLVTLDATGPDATTPPRRVGWIGSIDDLVAGLDPGTRIEIDPTLGWGHDLKVLNDGRIVMAVLGSFIGTPSLGLVAFDPADLDVLDARLPRRSELFGGAGASHRSPALAVLPSGEVLAFADERDGGPADLPGSMRPVVRRSTDGGEVFGAAMPITGPAGTEGDSRATVVVDSSTGGVVVGFNRGDGVGFRTSSFGVGPNALRNLITISDDGGQSFGPAVDVTGLVKDPFWRATRFTGGAGVQLPSGRLLLPFLAEDFGGSLWGHTVASDDGGATWSTLPSIALGATRTSLRVGATGELIASWVAADTAAERRESLSFDGGLTWSEVTPAAGTSPVPTRSDLLVLTPGATPDGLTWWVRAVPAGYERTELTLEVSTDGGVTWPRRRTLRVGGAGDASLGDLGNGSILVLFERGMRTPYDAIELARVRLDWLNAASN